MDVGLGMHLLTRDDQDIGTVDRLILDPDTGAVTSIVIRKGAFLRRDVEVPMGALEVESDGEVRLSYTANQIDELPPFVAGKYGPPPAGYASPLGHPVGALYWPLAAREGTKSVTPEDKEGAAQQRNRDYAEIRKGSAVVGREGKEVGIVDRLTYDPNNGSLRRFVVREGLFFTRNVELPASLIAGADDGMIRLNVDSDELRDYEVR